MAPLVYGPAASGSQRQFIGDKDPAEPLKASTFPDPTLKHFFVLIFSVLSLNSTEEERDQPSLQCAQAGLCLPPTCKFIVENIVRFLTSLT